MTDFLVFSDFHAHNFTAFSKQVPFSGPVPMINSRLKDCVLVLRQMRKYAEENSIRHVLFGGDLFHSRSAVKTDVYNVIYREIEDWMKPGRQSLIMIPGNHDMADREGHVHSLYGFKRIVGVRVFDEPQSHFYVRGLDGVAVAMVPYTNDREEAQRRLEKVGELADKKTDWNSTLLLAHLGMQGAKVGSDYVLVSDSDVSVSDVPHDKFSICLFGHYHQHQQLFDNGWFIGATHHHNWGDAGTTRGFLHLTVDDTTGVATFKQIESVAPRFTHVIDSKTMAPYSVRPTDFVRVHTELEITDELKQGLTTVLSPNIEIVPKRTKKEEQAFELNADDIHPAGLVEAWVTQRHGGLDQEKLKKIGNNLLAKAESRSL